MNCGPGGRFELESHDSGPWLLRTRGGSYAIPAELGRLLSRLDGDIPDREKLREILGGSASAADPDRVEAVHLLLTRRGEMRRSRFFNRGAMWIRGTFLPARLTARTAGRLSVLAGWRSLSLHIVIGTACYLIADSMSGASPDAETPVPLDVWVLGAALLFLSALWHELGHASALAREGYRPGAIGIGILLLLPVLWCDVSAVAALSRNGRMRVDVAGVCWQLGAGGAMALAAACGGPAALRLGSTGVLLAVGWSLLPLLRTDGAWLAKDYLDGAGRENARTIRLVRLFQAAGPMVVAAMLCRNAWRWLRVESERSEPWTTLAAAALIVVVVVVSAAAVKRASRLVKGAMPGNGSG